MLKQYFTDGLVQIAIVLSLLRTDLNSYLSNNYVSYPEVQELIMGQTAAYTQTNFHNTHNFHLGSPEIYRKNIDYISPSAIYRELRTFQHISNSHSRNIPTYLLLDGNENSIHLSQDADQATDNEDANNNNSGDQSLTSEDLEEEGQNLLNTLEESIQAMVPLFQTLQGDDPSTEDLDLIEVLWRQDIDLGAGKEVFDPNLRQELEREREIELQKERQKQKEQEILQKKLEERHHQAQQRWLNDNFTQDGETGEWVPLGGTRVPPPPPAPDLGMAPETGEQFLSSLGMLNNDQSGGVYTPMSQGNHVPHPQYRQPQAIQPGQMYNPNMTPYGQAGQTPYMGPSTSTAQQGFPVAPQQSGSQQGYMAQQNVQGNMGYHQPPQYNNTQNFNQQNYSQMQNMQQQQHQQQQQQQQQQHQHQQQQQQYPRQSSLEATWQDLVNILDLPANQTNSSAAANASMVNNTLGTNNSINDNINNSISNNNNNNGALSSMDNTSSILLQNASMPTPAPMSGNISFNNSGLDNQSHRTPVQSSGMLSPVQSLNSSLPSGSGGTLNTLDWESCGEFLFPNMTGGTPPGLTQTESLDDVDELLPDLITEDELEDINFSEMDLSDAGITSSPSRTYNDDASSDSAVSMGSQSVGSPSQNDFSDGAMSPFDGLEGATGGHDASRFQKTSKYDPDDFKYGNSCSYSSCGDSNNSNFSSSSNDTNGGSPYGGRGNGSGHFSPSSNGHINHNHTYPMKPGADPKDIKKHMLSNKEHKQKGPQSKDFRRIEELNIPFTLDQIVNSPVEEFNDMLTRHKLTDPQLQVIRDIRRRGKNKVAAQNCRKRKMGVLENLEDEMTALERMRDKLVHERHHIDKQTRDMKEKLGNLYAEIFHSLRDEHGQPYDPARFSLQQSSDGDVFLVPRNYTTEDDVNKKRKNDRKYE